MRTAVALAAMIFAAVPAHTQELTVLSEDAQPRQMMAAYLGAMTTAQLAARAERFEELADLADIAAYQAEMRAFFTAQLGGFPERTPLNARTVDAGEIGGVRYEKVIYESLPGYPVPALLFLPDAPPPYPAVLVPCGHSDNGKASEAYQRAAILLARNGMAALVYDPIGQGERYYYLKDDGKPEVGTTMHHTLMGAGCILTGTNIAMYRIYDGMRGIDYLLSRPEVDPDRIGCTGNSGGGTLTSYIMALDERVRCAAPSCYLTSFERLLDTIRPQDAEQNIFGQIAAGMNHADYVHMRAPKPTLICAATRDFFDIGGTWDTFREAKRLYAFLGHSERVDLIEFGDEHGFSQPRREAAARWMSRWLLGVDAPITEPAFDVLTDEQALCTPEGHVVKMEGTRTIFDLIAERADQLAPLRAAFLADADGAAFAAKVRRVTGARTPDELPEPRWEAAGTLERAGYRVNKAVIHPEPGILLPVLEFVSDGGYAETVIYAHGGGKNAQAEPGGPIEAMVREGKRVIAVDLRSTGETRATAGSHGWDHHIGSDWPDFFHAYLAGKSFVGMRVEDLMQCARLAGGPVSLHAVGGATVPALHAAVLEPALFAHVTLEGGIPSWDDVVRTPRAQGQLENAVHGALAWYDLPDLVARLPEGASDIRDSRVPVF